MDLAVDDLCLDILDWDFCLGVALLLAALVFSGSRLALWVRRGLVISGLLCLGGLLGAVLADMNVGNIGVLGYPLVLPFVMLRMGRLFAATPATDDRAAAGLAQRTEATAT